MIPRVKPVDTMIDIGLLRDAFTDNNWKMKIVQLRLCKTVEANGPPRLQERESLQEMMALLDIVHMDMAF